MCREQGVPSGKKFGNNYSKGLSARVLVGAIGELLGNSRKKKAAF